MALSMNTVVIAEDNLEISEVIKEHFERVYGLTVKTTDRAEQILPLVLKTKASVLIMDLELKDGDASGVVKEVAAIPELIVIIFTGTWTRREEAKLLENGAQVVMRKPQKAATIWQQVLTLRKIQNLEADKAYKVTTRSGEFFYEGENGILGIKEGKKKLLVDTTKLLMDCLAQGLAEYFNLSDEEIKEKGLSASWLEREEIIQFVYECEQEEVNGFSRAFQYQVVKLMDILSDFVERDDDCELIERNREGRYDSFYRLNPEVFHASEISAEAEEVLGS